MKVWVTGAGGLLGSALMGVLRSHRIPSVGSLRAQADVTDSGSLARFYRAFGPFTHIVNCAAYTHVDGAESYPEEAHMLNAVAPALIGLLAAEQEMRVVHISTDYVFGGFADRPYLETDEIAPCTVYGQTKAEGERHLIAALSNACILRTSWLFGTSGKHFVSTMLKLMGQREEIAVVSDQRGRPTFAPDLAEVIVHAFDWSGIYHVANQGETTWADFAKVIRDQALAFGHPIVCRTIRNITTAEFAAAAERPAYSVLDTNKVEQKLGAPLHSWRKGLNHLLGASYAGG